MKLLQIIITAKQLMVSPDQSKGQTHRFHRLTSSIKGFHFYQRTPDVSKTLKSVLEETNRHSNTALKVVGTPIKQLDVYLMDYLRPLHQQNKLPEVTGHFRDATEGK